MTLLTFKSETNQLSRSSFFTMIRQRGCIIVRPCGERLGEGEATVICPDVKAAITSMGRSFRGLVLDLSEVSTMSSYGLGMCIELRNHAKLARGEAVLYGLSPDIRELFRIMQVDGLFTLAMTERQLAEFVG